MNDEKTRYSIISDLVKIDKYRSHLPEPDRFFSQEAYADQSIADLKKIHDIYTRYLLDYGNLGEPYPEVIESLEYTNSNIDNCIREYKK